jgi:predicted ATPase/DNA-binding SARP family transcriptional activator
VAALNTDRLPVRLVPLVGRQRELQEVVAALSRSRLMSLTGPGGTGKTRLALAATAAARAQYADGVCWVELAPIADPGIVAQAVAASLGVPENPGQEPAATIAEYVGDRRMLIVLDNCEHLAAAAADLADRLLGSCPGLSILTTSRELLGVDGEHSWPVPPLALPAHGPLPPVPALAEFDAVRFFEQRAQLVLPSFRLADDNAAAVLQVCRRLDGLPLAIELAAARLRVLSPGQLAAGLDDIFTMLAGGARTAPARHQALRATLDWSHDLLDTDERAVFRRLAVFAGGFTLTTAGQVACGDDIGPLRMLELLTRLADKSLLRVEHEGADARFHLLATVRDYALERLAEAGEEEPTRRAHLQCCVDLVEQAAPRIEQDDQGQGTGSLEHELDRLDAETPNLRTALEFARDSGDAVAGLRIAAPLGRYAYLRGHYQEVRQWLDAAVTADPHAPGALRARALLGSGRLALLQCDYAAAVRRLEAALRLLRDLGDAPGIASALQVLGSVSREQGRYARSMELHRESLAVAESAGDRRAMAGAHGYLGFASWLQCDFELASAECTTALAMSRELGDVEGIAWSLLSLGAIARYQQVPDRAATLLAESRSLSERIGFREGVAWSLEQLGLLAADGGDPAAAGLLRQSLQIHRELHDRWRTASVLADLAAVALGYDCAVQAARLLAAAQAMRDAIGTVIAPCESARHAQTLAGAQAALGDEAFATAWQQGLQAPVDDLETDLPVPVTGPAGQAAAAGMPVPGPELPAPGGQSPDPHSPGPLVPAAAAAALPPQVLISAPRLPAPAAPGPADPATPPISPADPAMAAADPAAVAHDPAADARAAQHWAAQPVPRAAARRPQPSPRGVLRIRALGEATVQRGDVAVTAADWGYAKPRELLFLLATSPPQTREQLGVALWPDQPGQQLGNSLHTALRGLRRALGDPAWVVYSDGRYSFNSAREHDCDVTTFEQALAAARRARPAAAALPELQRAIAAYGGDLLAGLTAGEWAQTRRDELRRSYESALLAAGRLHAAAGRYQPAVGAFRRAVAHEPLNETAHRELMDSWARLGETARAVRHYEELTELLAQQVGVPPSAETTALYRRLLGAL